MTTAQQTGRPVIVWFALFALGAIVMPLAVTLSGLENRTIAALLIASPLLLMIKAALNAMHNDRHTKGGRGEPHARYVKRMLVITGCYIASLIAALTFIAQGDQLSPLTIILAVLPGLAVAAYFWAIARLMIEMEDEFLKMLIVRQSLVATGFAMAAASIYGFLENFGLVPHVDAFWWPIVWFAGLGVGAIANKMQFGTTGEAM